MEVAVIHHTQCGTGFLASEEFRHAFGARTGLGDAQLAAQAVTDPAATVRADVERLLTSPLATARIVVSGHVSTCRPASWPRSCPPPRRTPAGSRQHEHSRRTPIAGGGPARLAIGGARPGLVLAVVLLAAFVINLDTTIVNVALPALSRQLHATTSDLQWSSTPTTWPSPGSS